MKSTPSILITVNNQRDRDFEVRIGNSPDFPNNPLCVKFVGMVPEEWNAECDEGRMCGRYISVQSLYTQVTVIQICEVEALACEHSQIFFFSAIQSVSAGY